MYKGVHDLTKEQFEELKERYFSELEDEGKYDEVLAGGKEEDIPDEFFFQEYDSTLFTDDDFFCSARLVLQKMENKNTIK